MVEVELLYPETLYLRVLSLNHLVAVGGGEDADYIWIEAYDSERNTRIHIAVDKKTNFNYSQMEEGVIINSPKIDFINKENIERTIRDVAVSFRGF